MSTCHVMNGPTGKNKSIKGQRHQILTSPPPPPPPSKLLKGGARGGRTKNQPPPPPPPHSKVVKWGARGDEYTNTQSLRHALLCIVCRCERECVWVSLPLRLYECVRGRERKTGGCHQLTISWKKNLSRGEPGAGRRGGRMDR